MVPVVKDDINAFIGAIAETPELWRSINFRVVAIWAHGEWHNLVTTAHLDWRAAKDVNHVKDLPRLDRLVVLQEVFPIEVLPKLIQRVRLRGIADVAGTSVQYLGGYDDERFTTPYRSSYHRRGLSLDDYIRGPSKYGHALLLFGENSQELFSQFPGGQNGIDVALRRAGWQSLDELTLRGLDDVLRLSSDMGRRLAFIAPLELTLLKQQCSLQAGELEYIVLAGSRAVGDRASLSAIGEGVGGERIARTTALAGKRWGKQKTGFRHSGRMRLPKARKVRLTLHVAGYEVSHVMLTDQARAQDTPPLLMLAHEAIFTGERPFRDVLLEPQSNEGRPFERAVAKLFGYCGFPSDQPGKVPKEQNGPDVLVEVPDRNLLLVLETTVKHLMNDEDKKMNRLTKRAATLRLALKDANAEVIPVMVVPAPRETLVPVEVEEAEKNGVRILCKEDLAELLTMALAHTPIRKIAHYIVPEPPKPRTGRFLLPGERNPLVD